MKTNVAFFYGCRSVEHEVSIISAVQAMRSIDREQYDVMPVWVSTIGEMYTSEKMFEIEPFSDNKTLVAESERVTMIKSGNDVVLHFLKQKMFKKKDKEAK